MVSVKIYSTPTCAYCKKTKEFFQQNNVKYEEIDVARDEAKAKEMVEKSGQMGVPVVDIDGQIIIGFDREALKKALHLA